MRTNLKRKQDQCKLWRQMKPIIKTKYTECEVEINIPQGHPQQPSKGTPGQPE